MTIRVRDIELCLWEGLESPPASSDRVIYLHKDPSFLRRLEAALERAQPKRMIEVGILEGGSTIYWQARFQLERLIAFDIRANAPQLTSYLERHGLDSVVRTHFGVSQDDAAALQSAVAQSGTRASFDAIIDDASHQYAQTRATIEILLPFLRPGGAYVIEDWAWGHSANWPPDVWASSPLMSPLLSELMLVCGSGAGLIDRIEIDPNFAVLWRGDLVLAHPDKFRVRDHYTSRGFATTL